MANLRQTILIRTDLQFPTGLLAAQIAHLHGETIRQAVLESVQEGPDTNTRRVVFGDNQLEWLEQPYIYVHGVPNMEVLYHFKRRAKDIGVPFHVWKDAVYINISPTQREAFEGVEVGIVLGPSESDKIKAVIGDLPLLP